MKIKLCLGWVAHTIIMVLPIYMLPIRWFGWLWMAAGNWTYRESGDLLKHPPPTPEEWNRYL